MKRAGTGELQRHYPVGGAAAGAAGTAGAAGEIAGLREAAPAARPGALAPVATDEASLAAPELARDPVLAMLGQQLGARLSSDNLAWRGDPVPTMRSLQKMLVAHSLTLGESEREPALGAIRAVELAVRWRLRWMQMRRSEAESHFIETPRDEHATPNNT